MSAETGEIVKQRTLVEEETIINRELTTARDSFVAIGHALSRVRDEQLFVGAGFDSFETYCQRRWALAPATASQYIHGAQVADVLRARELVAPATEFVVRPLVKVLKEDGEGAVVEVWSQIVAKHEKEDRPISGRDVQKFLTLGANYNKPSWHELLGTVGDDLIKADHDLAKVLTAIQGKEPKALKSKAIEYAQLAEALAQRLRAI